MNNKSKIVLKIIFSTWLFWFLFSLINPNLLLGIGIPFLLLIPAGLKFYLQFWGFLWMPVVAAFILTVAVIAFCYKKKWFCISVIAKQTILMNFIFLFLFLIFADLYKNYLIYQKLEGLDYECLEINTFLEALSHGARFFQFDVHASYKIGEQYYIWSYKKNDFIQIPSSISKNINSFCEEN